MIETDCYKLTITLTTPLLGSQPTRDIATEYLAAKSGFEIPQDELDMLPEVLEKGTTVFHRNSKGDPCLMNYQILGFLKEAGRVLNGKAGPAGKKVKNLRSKVNSLIYISPRVIPLNINGHQIAYLERPLRAETMQGPRVALARSEMLPEGTSLSCNLEVIDSELCEEVLNDLLSYGFQHGLGQWRNSSAYGTFTYKLEKQQ